MYKAVRSIVVGVVVAVSLSACSKIDVDALPRDLALYLGLGHPDLQRRSLLLDSRWRGRGDRGNGPDLVFTFDNCAIGYELPLAGNGASAWKHVLWRQLRCASTWRRAPLSVDGDTLHQVETGAFDIFGTSCVYQYRRLPHARVALCSLSSPAGSWASREGGTEIPPIPPESPLSHSSGSRRISLVQSPASRGPPEDPSWLTNTPPTPPTTIVSGLRRRPRRPLRRPGVRQPRRRPGGVRARRQRADRPARWPGLGVAALRGTGHGRGAGALLPASTCRAGASRAWIPPTPCSPSPASAWRPRDCSRARTCTWASCAPCLPALPSTARR